MKMSAGITQGYYFQLLIHSSPAFNVSRDLSLNFFPDLFSLIDLFNSSPATQASLNFGKMCILFLILICQSSQTLKKIAIF